MDLFLAHSLLLVWASIGAARRLAAQATDQLLTAALLGWGNIVVTCLALSWAHQLGETKLFFGTSLLLAAVSLLALLKTQPPAVSASSDLPDEQPNAWLRAAFLVTIGLLAAGQLWTACIYQPSDADALSYQLPRTMYYLGQGSLAHFSASDLRQTGLPFNYNLLQAFGLVYGPPLQVLNFINLTAWVFAGCAVYRLCRHLNCAPNPSLWAAWLALMAPPVLRAATSAAPELAGSVALVGAALFARRWQQTGQIRFSFLAGLATGLAAGSSLGLLACVAVLVPVGAWRLRQQPGILHLWFKPGLLALAIGAPFAGINLAQDGSLLSRDLLRRQWLGANPWALLPVLLILGPVIARLIARLTTGPAIRSIAGRILLMAVIVVAAWSAAADLLSRPGRPLLPLLKGDLVAPGLPTLPLLPEFRLKDQAWINVDTDGVDECIFPFMVQRRHTRVTAGGKVAPAAYNLFSRAELSRNAAYVDARGRSAYSLVPVPAKRTAGVEFLATLGRGATARDYFGLAPLSGKTPPFDSNRSLLVTVAAGSRPSGQATATRIAVAGLNPEDRARLSVIQEKGDGSAVSLATFAQDGETRIPISEPFDRLLFRVSAAADDSELGLTALPYRPSAAAAAPPIDPLQPTGARSIFVVDAVVSRSSNSLACEGLLPLEGPFPQWNLPYFRWAKQPSVRLTLPPIARLARLTVSFSVQPQVRHAAKLDVLFNGRLVGHYELHERAVWLDQTLDLDPQPGENVLEFKDATHATEPDWPDYLQRYPDVKDYLEASHIPLTAGAREHFETHGRAEGRTVRLRETDRLEPAPQDYYFIYRSIRLEGFESP